MSGLTHEDYTRILKSIEVLNSGIESESLAKRLISSMALLVPNDIASFEAFKESGEALGIIVYEPISAVDNGDLSTYYNFIHEHPLFEAVFIDHQLAAAPMMDFDSKSDFGSSGLFNEYYRQVHIEKQISTAFSVDEEVFVTLAINRSKTDFQPIERELTTLFRPHIASAIRNSWVLDKVKERENGLLNILDQSDVGAITIGSDGRLQFLSRRAINIIGRFFHGETLTAGGLPLNLWNWATRNGLNGAGTNGSGFSKPFLPLRIETETETLSAEIAYDPGTGSSTILLKAKTRMNASGLEQLGLTKTEASVLYLLACGKTNADIAELNGVSPRTVQKHVENICNKLGVENRTAAAMRAMEIF